MRGFDIAADDRRLTLTRRARAGQWLHACAVVGGAACAISALGVFAALREVIAPPLEPDRSGVMHAVRTGHPLLALWAAGVAAIAVFLPFYAARKLLRPAAIVFDRERGALLDRGREVAALRRIERVVVRRNLDPDRGAVYTLMIAHTDGCEHPVERTYDDVEIWILAHEIADYLAVPAVGD